MRLSNQNQNIQHVRNSSDHPNAGQKWLLTSCYPLHTARQKRQTTKPKKSHKSEISSKLKENDTVYAWPKMVIHFLKAMEDIFNET